MSPIPRRLLYFADPMCSWCWGFSPVIEAVRQRCADDVAVLLVLGGLASGETRQMDAATKATIREHWEHVHEASGQPFDFGFFEREDFKYDTEPACRAVVAARQLDDGVAFAMLAAVHRAFYAEGRDVTDPDVLADVAVTLDLDRASFLATIASASAHHDTQRDFGFSQLLGVRGFPTMVGHDGQSMQLICRGYAPLETVASRLDGWLSGEGQ